MINTEHERMKVASGNQHEMERNGFVRKEGQGMPNFLKNQLDSILSPLFQVLY